MSEKWFTLLGFCGAFSLALAACSKDEPDRVPVDPGGAGDPPTTSTGAQGGAGGEGALGAGGEGEPGASGGSGSLSDPCDGLDCGTNGECVLVGPTAFCECKAGYEGRAPSCTDIAECAQQPSVCGENSNCIELGGGHSCECKSGFTDDGSGCVPFDACAAGIDACDDAATCSDLGTGDYSCACDSGQGDGFFCDGDCSGVSCGSGSCRLSAGGGVCECPLGTSGAQCAGSCSTASFSGALEEAVRLATGVPTGNIVPATHFAAPRVHLRVSSPFADDPAITGGLGGLECWTTLESFAAPFHSITDISALSGLTALETVDLSCNPLESSDLQSLSDLTNLTRLTLDKRLGCTTTESLADLSFLSSLIALETLTVDGHQLTSLAPLARLKRLRTFSAARNSIDELSVFAGLTSLESVGLSDNEIEDASALSSLRALGTLSLARNKISSVSAFAGLSNLRSLDISENEITTLQPLVDEASFGTGGGRLYIGGNPLPCASEVDNIEALEARGLSVFGECVP